MVGGPTFDRGGNLKEPTFVADRRDELQADGQAFAGEACGDGDGGATRGGDHAARHHPAEVVGHLLAADLGWELPVGGERCDLRGGQGEDVDVVEKVVELSVEPRPEPVNLDDVVGGNRLAVGDVLLDCRFHLAELLGGEQDPEPSVTDAPDHAEDTFGAGERDVEFDVIEYLKTPLTTADLERFVDLLPNEPGYLVRKDKRFKDLGLNAGDYTSKQQVVDILLEHPALMERPVIINGEKAVIARPSEKVEELL